MIWAGITAFVTACAVYPIDASAQSARTGDEAKNEQPSPSRFDPLVQEITTLVAPESWTRVGGSGRIQAVDDWGLLLIAQTPEIHGEIEALITRLRTARTQQANGRATSQRDAAAADVRPKRTVWFVGEDDTATAGRQRINNALSSLTTFDFEETPLIDVIEFIRKKHGIPIHIDARVLQDSGIGSDMPVTLKLKNVTLRSALRVLLRQLNLTFVIRDEVLLITVPVCEPGLITGIYAVADLAVANDRGAAE